jgi:hypothetical protein
MNNRIAGLFAFVVALLAATASNLLRRYAPDALCKRWFAGRVRSAVRPFFTEPDSAIQRQLLSKRNGA